ncbi:ABC transporter permease [Arhodomonas sp. AD133]|uniref:ABC transporter permease n=1 Tax=Arhodomonas sp. AD133 TaxID=3415009 RepID=UPI003EB99F57
MTTVDGVRFAVRALAGYRNRSQLMLAAMAIGVAAVVVLTGLGESARRYVAGEFAALGTNLLVVLPGRNETTGGAPPIVGATPRDLTIDDALALYRSRAVARVAPLNVGEAPVSHGRFSRDVTILGTTAAYDAVRSLHLESGRFLPEEALDRPSPVVVLGVTVRQELFGDTAALGRWVRIGDRRFRVIGISVQRGQSLGVDMDDVAIIPVASAQALFDTPSLFRILVQVRERGALAQAQADVRRIIRERHEGEDDVTVITQDSVLAAFDRILSSLTLAVGGIAAISLVVAGVLIMNVMLIAVSQRTAEIGLLRALGASRRQVLALFLGEALLLASAGTVVGIALGLVGGALIHLAFPVLQPWPPVWAPAAAAAIALVTTAVFAWLPARRAARLDPIVALAGH